MTTTTQVAGGQDPNWRRSSVWSVSGLLASRGATFATTLIAVRLLSPGEFGFLSYAMTLAGMSLTATVLGYDTLLFRDLITGSRGATVADVLATKLRFGFLSAAGFIAFYAYTMDDASLPLIAGGAAVVLGSLFAGLGETPEAVLAAGHRYALRAAVQSVPYVAGLGLVLAIGLVGMRGSGALLSICLILALRDVSRCWYGLSRLSWPDVRHSERMAWGTSVALARKAWPFAAVAALGYLYLRIDSVMLLLISGPSELGVYAASFNVYTGFFVITAALGPVIMQRVAVSNNGRSMWGLIGVFGVVGGLLAVLTCVFARDIVQFVYGDEYSEAGSLVAILAVGVPFAYANSAALRACYVNRLEFIIPIVLGVGVVVTIVGNAYAIPRYAATGAAVTTVITEAVLLVGFVAVLRRPTKRVRSVPDESGHADVQ